MREVNFSIPNANKASVGITPALYDRRALDCTSTLPLINSLNNLVYLTTSSARIRDILCVDGGIERLICILKEGRNSKDLMEYWMWNLAFQSVVNIGVRGSENVRTRVVEADIVPVIATILDNYIRVLDRAKERCDAEHKRNTRHMGHPSSRHHHRTSEHQIPGQQHGFDRIRRQAPAPIEIPARRDTAQDDSVLPASHSLPNFSLSSPPERTTFGPQAHHHHHHHHHRHHHHHHHARTESVTPSLPVLRPEQPAALNIPTNNLEVPTNDFTVRPVRDEHRLPSMIIPPMLTDLTSRPESPTTPSAPSGSQTQLHRPIPPTRIPRRPSIRHQLSVSGVAEDQLPMPAGIVSDENATGEASAVEPIVDIQTEMNLQDAVESENILDAATSPMGLDAPVSDAADETFDMARSALEGSALTAAATADANGAQIAIPPPPVPSPGLAAMPTMATLNPLMPPPHAHMHVNPYIRYLHERIAAYGFPSPIPREEDVLMCLQLLAYVSKYCNLRTYFQKTHLVPRLKLSEKQLNAVLNSELPNARPFTPYPQVAQQAFPGITAIRPTTPVHPDAMQVDKIPAFNAVATPVEEMEEEEEEIEEYLQPDDFNIFPLVEKFTVRHHTHDMLYWAGVVMRNLCRKDDSRDGIRQCAYYKCGKWEEYTRQFAKCRRCRRTKYCSKECQKSAWVFHRHWCVPASDGQTGQPTAQVAGNLVEGQVNAAVTAGPVAHHHHAQGI